MALGSGTKNLNFSDVEIAAARVLGKVKHTPLLSFQSLNRITGANVWIKPETLQETGSFKFRGAYNAISAIPENKRKYGVVAASSGNHAQGIAHAASLHGITSHIVMPIDAPAIKIERTKKFGGIVRLYDRYKEDRVAIANEIAAKNNATFIHPYENLDVIAGQGTCGLEICDDLKQQGEVLDRMLVCTGGGGLIAGITLAVANKFPNAKIHACEPYGFDDYARSLVSGTREQIDLKNRTICDAIMTPSPGENSFNICKNYLSEGLQATDQEVLEAVAFAFSEMKLVVEPGGAIALACLLNSAKQYQGETIALTLSGGNVDPKILTSALELAK